MTDEIKQQLAAKNQKLIEMVIQRAKRDFLDDIGLIGLTGSFATGDYHENSDLDLIIVNSSDEGWTISKSFILGNVGYDVYCTPWDNLERKAELECVGVSSLTDLLVLYAAKPEYLKRLEALQEKARKKLAAGVSIDSIKRADKHLDIAKQKFTDMILAHNYGEVRHAAAEMVHNLVNCIVSLNNTCIKRGIKRYIEELLTYEYLPPDFEMLYYAIIDSKTIENTKENATKIISAVIALRDALQKQCAQKTTPTYDNLKGWYEECWCNNRNKIIESISKKDKSYAFFAALGAQSYLDEMTSKHGTKKYDLIGCFDSDDMGKFLQTFLQAMDDILQEYENVGLKVQKFDTFDDLYLSFMKVKL